MLLAVCPDDRGPSPVRFGGGGICAGKSPLVGLPKPGAVDRPAGAASGDSFEYEAQLLLGDDVVESKAVEIDTYLFFTNDVVTRPQEEYTIRVRARWIMIVGDPDGQYMVADVGEAEPPHEHSYTQKHDAAQHWQACSCGDKKDAADHSFGAWTADGNTESRICTVCGYAETRDAAQTSATGETTDNGQDTGGCPAGACCLYSYTGKSGRHRITRQPEERIRPNRTAEIPKTDSTCKGGNEDASKKEFARAAAVLMHGGRNTAGDSVCCGAICTGKSPAGRDMETR